MTKRENLIIHLRVRLRNEGTLPSEIDRMTIWECLDDSRPTNDHIRLLADELGYDDSMSHRQTDGLIRDIRRDW